MAGTPTGTTATVRLEWVPGALRKCRNSPAAMFLVNTLGSQYLAKANGASKTGGYLLGLHMVAGTKYIANVYTGNAAAMRDNARNQTLAKLL